MKKITFTTLAGVFVLGAIFFLFKGETEFDKLPEPTEIGGEEDGENAIKREKWFELMHSAAPGADWRRIEYQHQILKHRQRVQQRRGILTRGGDPVEIAGGKLVGMWRERGSLNQAGSVFETDYDVENDEIWLVSAGGTIFKGKRSGSDWEVINQDIQFNNGLLKFIPHNGGRRLLAMAGKIPHFSDDDGKSWSPSAGVPVNDLQWADFRNVTVLDDSLRSIYLISKPSYSERAKVYKSVDHAETFIEIYSLNGSDLNRFALCKPHHSNDLFLVQKQNNQTRIFQINTETDAVEAVGSGTAFLFGNSPANLAATVQNFQQRFIAYGGNTDDGFFAYRSDDFGNTWEKLGQLESEPWGVGIYILPSDPNVLFAGEVHCQVSRNGGQSWVRRNDWWAYYPNVETALHADMMHFSEYTTKTGEVFQLVSNHGGLNVSYNKLLNISNLGLTTLNVSQYYDVRTDPLDPFFIYAGSQDQGFQRANSFGQDEAVLFDQVISGDYGHLTFSQNGQRLWIVYPGGSVSYYGDPYSGGSVAGWSIESDNESVWIPPMVESPYPQENAVYVAGGNKDGGSGSFLIRLEFMFGDIVATQNPFNFKLESGGEVSAIGFAKTNTDYWYVATTNGRFFYSKNAGQDWEQTINFIPDGHYLYGQAILVSRFDENRVFLGGSGYTNPAVYVSEDGGETFQSMTEGLPNTLVFGFATDPEEKMLFAATEAGPYVYIFEEAKWFDLSGVDAPTQTYWSVEYVPDFNLVRFGTYGRGIWDFEIQESVSAGEVAENAGEWSVFPNPSAGKISITTSGQKIKNSHLEIFDSTGKLLSKQPFQNNSGRQFDLSVFGKGVYFLRLENGKKSRIKKVVIH